LSEYKDDTFEELSHNTADADFFGASGASTSIQRKRHNTEKQKHTPMQMNNTDEDALLREGQRQH
jgi:hypothetical protein